MFRNTNTHQKLKRSVSILGTLMLSLFLVHCTEKRADRLDQNQRESYVNRAHIESTVVRIKTGSETVANPNSHLAIYEKPAYPVVENNAPADYAFMFQDLMVVAEPNTEYDVIFKAQKGSLRAYLVVEDTQKLSLLQYENIERYGDTGKYLVPIFSYRVNGYGTLENVLNDLDETTNRVRLARTNWDVATYIEISKSPTERTNLTVSAGAMPTEGERVFVGGYLNNAVTNKAELANKYEINLNIDDDAVLYTVISGNELLIYEVTTLNSDALDDGHRQIIKNNVASAVVSTCGAGTQGAIQISEGDQCVQLLRYKVAIQHVRSQQTPNWLDNNGQPASFSTEVTFVPAEPREQPGHIKIARNPIPTEVTPADGIELDPRVYLPVAELREGEYLYRRMLQDVPNNVPGLFTTLTGPIDIIKFRFLEDRVEGYRADATQSNAVNNSTDFETLFTIPAKYYKRVYQDAAGRPSSVPRLVQTTSTDTSAEVFVKMDWTNNRIENSGSPMSMLGFGEGWCFNKQSTRVADVDNRLGSDGVVSFTIEGRYSASPVYGAYCFGRYPGLSGYSNMWGTDSNFAVNERISIKKHNPENDKFQSLNLPRFAQKAFNFGAIHRTRSTPTSSGRAGIVGTETNLAVIHDFKRGPVTYVLKGVPERLYYGDGSQYVTREEMIQAAREVIADWNKTFREAFRGTPLETNQDLVILKVDGIDVNTTIGDLDVNHIYVEPSATGVPYLGVYIGTPNVRSGYYEAGNVNVFAGNIMASAEWTQWASRIKKSYLDDYRAAMTAAERAAQEAQREFDKDRVPQPRILGPRGGSDVTNEALAQAQGYINSLTASIAEIGIQPLFGNFSLAPNSKVVGQLPVVAAQDVSAVQSLNPALADNFSRLADIAKRVSESGGVNLSEVLESNSRLLLDTEKAQLWIQKGIDLAMEDVNKYGPHPMFFERGLIGAFLESRGSTLSPDEAIELSNRYSQLTMRYLSQFGPQGDLSCFYESIDMASEVIAGMPVKDLFLSMFKHTTSHELGHAFGLEHNFKGSVDAANFNFPGEKVERLSSSIMEYGTALERAKYAGPGPYDAHALRAIYTGLVEAEPAVLQQISEIISTGSDGRRYIPIKNPVNNDMIPMYLYGNRFVEIKDLIEYFTGKSGNLNRINEFDIERMPLPVKRYEFCSNGFEYYDPTCNMFDEGTNGPEIVDYWVGQYRASYELSYYIQDRTRFTIQNVLSNIGRAATYYYYARRFMDDAMFRLVNQRGTTVFGSGLPPRNYQEVRALDSYEAAVKARSFLLSVVHTPDAGAFTPVRERLQPTIVGVVDGSGRMNAIPYVIEKKPLYGTADNDYGYLGRAPFYIDKIMALNFLTQRFMSRELEGDILSYRAFSFLDFERYYLGVSSIENSFVGRSLAQILSDDLAPMVVPTDGPLFTSPLGIDFAAEIPSSLRFYAGLNAVLSLYVNALQQDYNFGADFMVYRDHAGSRSASLTGRGSFLVDLSRDASAQVVPRFFPYEGEYSKVANSLIHQGSFLRNVLEDDIDQVLEDFTVNRMSLLVAGAMGVLDLPVAALINETDEGVRDALAKKRAYELAQDKLTSRLVSLMGSDEEAKMQLDAISSYIDVFFAVAPQVVQLAQAGQNGAVEQILQQFETLGRKYPILVRTTGAIQSALEKVDSGIPAGLARAILPTSDTLGWHYGIIVDNVDLLNRLTSFIEPSARNN